MENGKSFEGYSAGGEGEGSTCGRAGGVGFRAEPEQKQAGDGDAGLHFASRVEQCLLCRALDSMGLCAEFRSHCPSGVAYQQAVAVTGITWKPKILSLDVGNLIHILGFMHNSGEV